MTINPENPFAPQSEPVKPPILADPLDDIVDSFDAANILGIKEENMRQLVFREQIKPVGRRKRRSLFNRADVEALAATRNK